MTAHIARHSKLALTASFGLLAGVILFPGAAYAAPGETASAPGAAEASVIEPLRIVSDDDLRFGEFTRPTAAGTLIIGVTGLVNGTAGMASSYQIAQNGSGRGPASFHLLGSPNRLVTVTLPNRFNISRGARRMRVDNLTINSASQSIRLDGTGYFQLLIGGRLNVGANQQLGVYSGTFDVTVVYQ